MNISRGEVDMRSFFCPELKVGHLNLEPYRGVNWAHPINQGENSLIL